MPYFEDVGKAMEGFNRQLESIGSNMKSSGQSAQSLGNAIVNLGNLLKVGGVQLAWSKIKDYAKEHLAVTEGQLRSQRMGLYQTKLELDKALHRLETSKRKHSLDSEQVKLAQENFDLLKETLDYDKRRFAFAVEFKKTITAAKVEMGVLAILGGLLLKLWRNTVEANRAINQSLIQANSAFGKRYEIVQTILKAQTQTGASTASMADSAEALVGYGMELESTFQENLKLVTMMKEGLGISAQTGANLVVVFERGLKQSARDVADLMARIVAETGLAAQKAAQYAIELARGLRLLGPMRTDATGVARAVEGMAARVEELGGNSEIVVSLYKRMLEGSKEAFVLRGTAGVAGREATLGTAAGAQAAMEGLAVSMQRMVTAGPGTMNYMAQLQMAAEYHGVAAADVRDYLEAIKLTKRPLTEAEALQKAYRQQTQEAGKAWEQIKNSLATLYMRVLTPILKWIAPAIRGFADFTTMLANTKVAVVGAAVGMSLSLLAAVIAMSKLTAATWRFVKTSAFGEIFPHLGAIVRAIPLMGRVALYAPALAGIRSIGALAGAGGGLAGGAAGLGIAGAAVVGAGLLGYGVGSIINRIMPQSWRDLVGNSLLAIAKATRLTADYSKQQTHAALSMVRTTAADEAKAAARKISAIALAGGGAVTAVEQEAIMKVMTSHLARLKAGQPWLELTPRAVEGFREQIAGYVDPAVKDKAYAELLRTRTTVMLEEDRKRSEDISGKLTATKDLVLGAQAQQRMAKTVEKLVKNQETKDALDKTVEHGRLYYLWGELGGTPQSAYTGWGAWPQNQRR